MLLRPHSDPEIGRLKELLFGQEERVLAEIARVVDEHHHRIGTDERFEESLAEAISGALQRAEISNHEEISVAISPFVIAGIRREIHNSRDSMVDALYPILGRLVAAYVSNAIRTFLDETNRRLERTVVGRKLQLRLRSLLTGQSYAALALLDSHKFEIRSLLLIRRPAGLLLDLWLAKADDPDNPLKKDGLAISGLLTAINEFAHEAFAKDGSDLRALDLGDSQIFIRATPAHLIAIDCTGLAPRKLGRVIDRELIEVLEAHAEALAEDFPPETGRRIKTVLPDLAERLNRKLSKQKKFPLLAVSLLVLIAIAAAGWFGWNRYIAYKRDQLRTRTAVILLSYQELGAYPMKIRVGDDASSVNVSGLVPTPELRQKVIEDLEAKLGATTLRTDIAVLPTVSGLRHLSAGQRALEAQLHSLEAGQDASQQALRGLTARTGQTAQQVATLGQQMSQGLDALEGKMARLLGRLEAVEAQLAAPDRKLALWVRRHAIFYLEETNFREPKAAERLVGELSALLLQTKAKLRVVGYTDTKGTDAINTKLALERSQQVVRLLVERGVPPEQLVAIGRPAVRQLTVVKDPGNSSRRVEFEITFAGE